MFCANCGAGVSPGSKFCTSCGIAVDLTAAGSTVINNAAKIMDASNAAPGLTQAAAAGAIGAAEIAGTAVRSKMTMSAVAGAIVIAGIILYNMFFVVKPVDIVYKFIAAVNEKDINTAVSCLDPKYEKMYNATSNILESVVGVNPQDVADLFPALYDFARQEGEDLPDTSMEIKKVISEEINNDQAAVVVNIEVKDQSGQVVDGGDGTVYLQKFNCGWRITNLQ